MDIHARIAAAEQRVQAATHQFVNSAKATPEQHKEIDAELREATAELQRLRDGLAMREALNRLS